MLRINSPVNPNKAVDLDLDKILEAESAAYLAEYKLDESEENVDNALVSLTVDLTAVQINLSNMYHNDRATYDEFINAMEIDENLRFELVDGDMPVRLIVQDNPRIYLDTPLLDGESKIDRIKLYNTLKIRIHYQISLADALRAMVGTVPYEGLSEDSKTFYNLLKDHLLDPKEDDVNKN